MSDLVPLYHWPGCGDVLLYTRGKLPRFSLLTRANVIFPSGRVPKDDEELRCGSCNSPHVVTNGNLLAATYNRRGPK